MSARPHENLTVSDDAGRAIRFETGAATGAANEAGASGVELARYVYRPREAQFESPRPYLHPIRTLSGRLVTVFRPWDHVWHKGITMALPNVGADNFWGGATYTRKVGWYADLKNNGSQDHERVEALDADDDAARFVHTLTWRKQPPAGEPMGATVITERRTITARLAPQSDAWILGWTSTLTNASGAPIELGSPTTEGRENAGYGGLFWRGPRSFTGGYMVGGNGVEGESLRGTKSEWAGFSGRHDEVDGESTVVFVDATPEQDLDTEWFARSEPFACLNPAPFFETVRVFEPDETLELGYAVAIADGASDAARMGELADVARMTSMSAAAAARIAEVN